MNHTPTPKSLATSKGIRHDDELQLLVAAFRGDKPFDLLLWLDAVTTGTVVPAANEPGTFQQQILALDLAELWALSTKTTMRDQWAYARCVALPHAECDHTRLTLLQRAALAMEAE